MKRDLGGVPFYSVMSKLGRTLASRKVSISFEGDEVAISKGDTGSYDLTLPWVPPGSMVTKEESRVWQGFLDREVAGIRFDRAQLDSDQTPLVDFLTTVIEDVRVELSYLEMYPGARVNLDAVHRCKARNAENMPLLAKELRDYLLWEFRGLELREDEFEFLRTPQFRDLMSMLWERVPDLRCGAHSRRLAEDIEQFFLRYSPFSW